MDKGTKEPYKRSSCVEEGGGRVITASLVEMPEKITAFERKMLWQERNEDIRIKILGRGTGI